MPSASAPDTLFLAFRRMRPLWGSLRIRACCRICVTRGRQHMRLTAVSDGNVVIRRSISADAASGFPGELSTQDLRSGRLGELTKQMSAARNPPHPPERSPHRARRGLLHPSLTSTEAATPALHGAGAGAGAVKVLSPLKTRRALRSYCRPPPVEQAPLP